jgi:DedD protein
MALFKLRKKVDAPIAASPPAESIEVMRRRARHRLIGAVVLVLVGVIGFPLLFDTQPRPVAVDIPIEIPDRNKAKPLVVPAQPQAPVAAGKITPVPAPTPPAAVASSPAAKPEEKVAEPSPPAETKVAKTESKPENKPEPKPAAKAEPKPAPSDDGAKAKALLEGKAIEAAAGARFVVQVGAFAEEAKAKSAQQKLERAGLKNYRNVAETKDGKRIRVRAGPFASRAEADQAAEKIKGLDLPAAILTL